RGAGLRVPPLLPAARVTTGRLTAARVPTARADHGPADRSPAGRGRAAAAHRPPPAVRTGHPAVRAAHLAVAQPDDVLAEHLLHLPVEVDDQPEFVVGILGRHLPPGPEHRQEDARHFAYRLVHDDPDHHPPAGRGGPVP